jgi:hypothetical protein
MTVYTSTQRNDVLWPEPFETIFQSLPSGSGTTLAPKLPHLSDWEALCLGSLPLIPKDHRTHGLITWSSDMFGVSRTSIYALGKRIQARLLATGARAQSPASDQPQAESALNRDVAMVEVTPERMKRTILATTFPGNVSIRPTQAVLEEAFDQSPSIGAISELRLEAGRQAGRVLAGLDYSPVGEVIVGRDETFFQGKPALLVIEPVSSAILLALACEDRQATTWGAALELVQEQGASIVGLVEDMARNYEKSQKLANLTKATVQKDVWHLQQDGSTVKRALLRNASSAMTTLYDLEKALAKEWDEDGFDQYVKAVAKEEHAIDEFDAYAELQSHLYDALEMVDWRAGDIRDRQIADWLLTETLVLMDDLTDPRVHSFVKTVRNHQKELFTCLDWIAADLPDWQARLSKILAEPDDADAFQRTVARHWRLQQMLINGHKQWKTLADDTALELDLWVEMFPALATFAAQLRLIIDAAGHTNSINECVNGILKSFLNSRQSFRNQETGQAYLDLFVLWHNMRIYQRGKRQGKSPFQIAGIETDSDDWLTLLGF